MLEEGKLPVHMTETDEMEIDDIKPPVPTICETPKKETLNEANDASRSSPKIDAPESNAA